MVKTEVEVKEEPMPVKEEMENTTQQQQEQEQQDDEEGERRGIKRAPSPSQQESTKKLRPDVEEVRVEDEPEFDKSAVVLDWCK